MTMNFPLILFPRSRLLTGLIALADRLVLAKGARRRRARAVVGRVSEELLSGAADRLSAALVRGRAVQDSVIVDAAHARCRGLHPRQQVRLRPAAADSGAEDRAALGSAARRCRRFPLPAQSVAGLHQAGHRPPRGHGRLPGQAADGQRRAVGAAIRRQLQLSGRPALRDDGAVLGSGAGRRRGEGAPGRGRPGAAAGQPGTGSRIRRARQLRLQFRWQRLRLQGPGRAVLRDGDNRDRSDDSRYWGFVPDDHLRGRAFFIWFNWDDISGLAFKRVGSGIK